MWSEFMFAIPIWLLMYNQKCVFPLLRNPRFCYLVGCAYLAHSNQLPPLQSHILSYQRVARNSMREARRKDGYHIWDSRVLLAAQTSLWQERGGLFSHQC